MGRHAKREMVRVAAQTEMEKAWAADVEAEEATRPSETNEAPEADTQPVASETDEATDEATRPSETNEADTQPVDEASETDEATDEATESPTAEDGAPKKRSRRK